MLFMKEFYIGCNLIGAITDSQRFIVFPDAQSLFHILQLVNKYTVFFQVHCPLGGFEVRLVFETAV